MTNIDRAAAEVLDFWFGTLSTKERFGKDPAIDRVIADRFGKLRENVLEREAADWRDTSGHLLAAIVLLDQFSRNLFRGQAAAYSADPLARSLSLEAIGNGWEEHYTDVQKQFLYLPLMHTEDMATQRLSMEKYEVLADPEALSAARQHSEVIARFGRFPSRNAALGRKSTQAEREFLQDGGSGW